MSDQSFWKWDQTRRLWYHHDRRTDQRIFYEQPSDFLVWEDGQRRPRSATNFPAPPTSLAGTYQEYPGSPTNDRGNYGLSSRASASSQGVESLDISSLRIGSSAQSSTGSHATAASAPAVLARMVQPQIQVSQGVRTVTARNEAGVYTRFATGPPEAITDPTLYSSGVRAEARLMGSPGEAETLYPSFRLQRPDFFAVGRVFMVLWSEPAGESTQSHITYFEPTEAFRNGVFTGALGERVHSKVRRFVVVRCAQGYCTAVPIFTYRGQGVAKPGVTKSEHAIIHTTTKAPQPTVDETPDRNERPMRSQSIRVVPDNPTDILDPMSRVNFGKTHTVEYNIKAKSIGNVHPHFMEDLTSSYANVALGLGSFGSSNPAPPSGRRRSFAGSSRTRSGAAGSVAGSVGSGGRVLPTVLENRQAPGRPAITPGERGAGEDEDEDEDEAQNSGEEEEEDEDDYDDDGDDTRAQRRPRADVTRRDLIIHQLITNGWSREQAITDAGAALHAQNQYAILLQRGLTHAQAVLTITAQIQQSTGLPAEAAAARLRSLLSFGTQANR